MTISDQQLADSGGISSKKNSINNFDASRSFENEIDFSEIWQALRRRKKIVISVAAASVIFSGLLAVYQRSFNPVFMGSFTLLIIS